MTFTYQLLNLHSFTIPSYMHTGPTLNLVPPPYLHTGPQLEEICHTNHRAHPGVQTEGHTVHSSASEHQDWQVTELETTPLPPLASPHPFSPPHRCPPAITELLRNTEHAVIEKEGVKPTKLCTHNEDVDAINTRELSALTGQLYKFTAHDSDLAVTKQLDTLCPAPGGIELKVGAQVCSRWRGRGWSPPHLIICVLLR